MDEPQLDCDGRSCDRRSVGVQEEHVMQFDCRSAMNWIRGLSRPASIALLIALTLLCVIAAQPALAWQVLRGPVAPREDDDELASDPPEVLQPARPDDGKITARRPDVKPASFKDITPGQSSADELRKTLGEPARRLNHVDYETYVYTIEPFTRVDFLVMEKKVTSIVIYLRHTVSIEDLASELGLSEFAPAQVLDNDGRALGLVYPERGLLFSFAGGDDKRQVGQIALERITAEPFVLRAQQSYETNFARTLADLEIAERYDAGDDRISALQARVLSAVGRYREAQRYVEQALRTRPEDPQYQLLHARILSKLDEHDRAIEAAKLVAKSDASGELKAEAEALLGDLLASGATRDYNAAIKHHLAAIKLAAPLANDRRDSVRRAAKRVLVDAHLAVAADIAWGKWRKKTDVVPKWMEHGEQFAEQLIEDEDVDPSLRLTIHNKKLTALAGISQEFDPRDAIEAAIDDGQRIIADIDEPLRRQSLEWLLGETLFDAARISHARQDANRALEYGKRAAQLISQSHDGREATPAQVYMLGRLYFLIGSLYAVQKNDHEEAVVWFAKSIPALERKLPTWAEREKGYRGEWFVSMGISYWHAGQREYAIQLTEYGIELIQQGVREGSAEESSLAIPYSNLATMYGQLGDQERAKTYSDRAKRYETAQRTQTTAAPRR